MGTTSDKVRQIAFDAIQFNNEELETQFKNCMTVGANTETIGRKVDELAGGDEATIDGILGIAKRYAGFDQELTEADRQQFHTDMKAVIQHPDQATDETLDMLFDGVVEAVNVGNGLSDYVNALLAPAPQE